MSRLLLIFIFISAVALVNGQQKPPLSDQITDDEDDLAMDMPQNGPDAGSGMDPDDEKTEPPPKLPKTTPFIEPAPVPTQKPKPEPEEEITVEKQKKTPAVVKPTFDPSTIIPVIDAESEAKSPAPLPSTGLSTGALVGIVVAVVLALLLIIIIIVCLVKRSKRNGQHSHHHQQQQTTKGRQQVPQV